MVSHYEPGRCPRRRSISADHQPRPVRLPEPVKPGSFPTRAPTCHSTSGISRATSGTELRPRVTGCVYVKAYESHRIVNKTVMIAIEIRRSDNPEVPSIAQHDKLALGLLVAAGLRRAEAVALTFEDVKQQPPAPVGAQVRTPSFSSPSQWILRTSLPPLLIRSSLLGQSRHPASLYYTPCCRLKNSHPSPTVQGTTYIY